jgi:hypothetical protein
LRTNAQICKHLNTSTQHLFAPNHNHSIFHYFIANPRTGAVAYWHHITNHTNHDNVSIGTSLLITKSSLMGKWWSFVDAKDGFFYGVPYNARRVVKFNPIDKSLTEIGPDLGEGVAKWLCGVRANNNMIYCTPFFADRILKIDPIRGTVETLDDIELPEQGGGLWASGALAADNNIYYMPFFARRMMQLNPDNDTLSSVGDDLGDGGWKYGGTVVGSDNCLYGIPYHATRIVKFDPTNLDTNCSTVGEETNGDFNCGNGVLGGDGYIYAANGAGQILQIDTTSNNYTWIGDEIYSEWGEGWGDPIVGVDKCIYWPPRNANRVLKFDHETQQLASFVVDDLGEEGSKWQGGALATDGVIYCIPIISSRVLAIDPFKEFSMTLQTNMTLYPDELGRLFLKDEEECDETFLESSIRKFGGDKVFKLIEECLPLDAEWTGAQHTNGNLLPPFMVAASCENCAVLSVIYYLLRRNVNGFLGNISGGSSN